MGPGDTGHFSYVFHMSARFNAAPLGNPGAMSSYKTDYHARKDRNPKLSAQDVVAVVRLLGVPIADLAETALRVEQAKEKQDDEP